MALKELIGEVDGGHRRIDPDGILAKKKISVLVEYITNLEKRLDKMDAIEKDVEHLKKENFNFELKVNSLQEILDEYDEVIGRLHTLLKNYEDEIERLTEKEKCV